MTVSIETLADDTGLLVEDRIEQRQCRILTAEPVTPRKTAADFLYPIDVQATITASELTISKRPTAYVRGECGRLIEDIEHFTERRLEERDYILEVPGPVKLYFQFHGPVSVSVDAVQMTLSFDEPRAILVGARSYHETPAATITTTTDPSDVMTAVSYFSSALKTTSPERSYPNLRGHPPELSVGNELDVPDDLQRPRSGLRIEVPNDLVSTLVVAPLAYYVGADVVRGERPRIVADSGFVHALDTAIGFENEVERVLKQVFFLDCLTRTEGTYEMPLRERQLVDGTLDVPFGDLYDADLATRLESYLSVPFESVEEYIPQWKLTAHVTPSAESVEILPFLVNDLAVIRSPADMTAASTTEQVSAIEEFVRDASRSSRNANGGPGESVPSFVEPEKTDSLEQAWVGDDIPIGASKAMVEAFRNRLSREEKEGDIDLVVVCNDSEMLDEHTTASQVYGSRDELPFQVTLYDDLTMDRLRLVLESDIDYFHYIGHIDEGGFECADGTLDAATVDSVGVDTFLLNACQSYHQGVELIRKGAIGGVVTLDEVINSGAIRVGKMMTRLLNRGFPLRAALNIAKQRSIVGSQYIVVGDGNADIAYGTGTAPNLVEITPRDGERFDVAYRSFYSTHLGMGVGSFLRPEIAPTEEHYLTGSSRMEFEVTRDRLEEFLELEIIPIRIDDQFSWSDQVDLDELV